MSGRAGEDALVVHNFSKTYGTFAAVKDVNFGLHYGECFGLLGVNGAGVSGLIEKYICSFEVLLILCFFLV